MWIVYILRIKWNIGKYSKYYLNNGPNSEHLIHRNYMNEIQIVTIVNDLMYYTPILQFVRLLLLNW